MKTISLAVMLTALALATLGQSVRAADACAPTLDFKKRILAGDEEVHLCEAYQGKVVLIVNTASKCGYTPQYEGLEALYRKYQSDGLVVLGFPSNDFAQEYNSEEKIQQFCRLTYSVEFPMFAKTGVREGAADPLYERLASLAGEYPRWNFHKYLIDREGRLVGSYPSQTRPESPAFVDTIERLLAAGRS
jgi:glutathione peroxidase